jgi:hypothetical protein
MSIQQMQQHIIEQVGAVKDEQILQMFDEELAFYLKHREDPAALLSEKDLEELTMLANEPIEKNTMSFNEFKSIMDKWRMK